MQIKTTARQDRRTQGPPPTPARQKGKKYKRKRKMKQKTKKKPTLVIENSSRREIHEYRINKDLTTAPPPLLLLLQASGLCLTERCQTLGRFPLEVISLPQISKDFYTTSVVSWKARRVHSIHKFYSNQCKTTLFTTGQISINRTSA